MKVLIGLSGGVDSAVAAHLLKKKGYEVIGITFKLNRDQSVEDAKNVAEAVGIPLHIADYSSIFKAKVIDYFFDSYLDGKTPNPCVICNREIKFKLLTKEAENLSCDFIATGHYAKIDTLNSTRIIKKVNSPKDQSYFLGFVKKSHINYIIFPLSEIQNKEETKELAKSLNLPVKSKESFDICFIKGDYREELKKRVKSKDGFFVLNGKKIKKHDGIFNYTIGQRKGIKIPFKEALYVESIDTKTGNIYLATKERIFKKQVSALIKNITFLPSMEFEAKAKLRSMMKEERCTVKIEKNRMLLVFEKEQFAPAPGQIAVVYYRDAVIMAGVIIK